MTEIGLGHYLTLGAVIFQLVLLEFFLIEKILLLY